MTVEELFGTVMWKENIQGGQIYFNGQITLGVYIISGIIPENRDDEHLATDSHFLGKKHSIGADTKDKCQLKGLGVPSNKISFLYCLTLLPLSNKRKAEQGNTEYRGGSHWMKSLE